MKITFNDHYQQWKFRATFSVILGNAMRRFVFAILSAVSSRSVMSYNFALHQPPVLHGEDEMFDLFGLFGLGLRARIRKMQLHHLDVHGFAAVWFGSSDGHVQGSIE